MFPNNQQSTLAEGLVEGNIGKLSFEKRITSLPWFLCASILSLHPTSKILFASAPYRQYPALKTYIQLAQASQHCLFKVVSRLIHVDPDKCQQLARSDEIWWDLCGLLGMGHRQNMEFWKYLKVMLESWQVPFPGLVSFLHIPATPSSHWMTKSFQPSDILWPEFKAVSNDMVSRWNSIALRASQQADWSAWVSCDQFFCVICRLKCLSDLVSVIGCHRVS